MLNKWVMTAFAIFASIGTARAEYPADQPVRLIVPYAAGGGGADTSARILAERLSVTLGQKVIVENKTGGNATIGSLAVANAKPDGYTLLFTTISHALNEGLYKDLPYDTRSSFEPITIAVKLPLLLVAHPSLHVSNVTDLISYLKAHPETTYGSAGVGGMAAMAGELFAHQAGIQLRPVIYRGEGPILADLLGGVISLYFGTVGGTKGHVQAGTLTAIAVTGSVRAAALPNIPTISEAGLTDYEASSWHGIFAPAGTSPEILARVNLAVREALQNPETLERYNALGYEVSPSPSPADAKAFVDAEITRWSALIKAAGIHIN